MARETVIGIKTALVAAWHGPFKIGPLRQPVSTGDAILRVLEVVWKAGVVAAVVVVAVVLMVLAAEVYSSYMTVRYGQKSLAANVKAVAKYDPSVCQEIGLPVAVKIENKAIRPLLTYAWRIDAFQVGHSTRLDTANGIWPSSHSDFIIQPGGWSSFCVPAPALKPGAPAPQALKLEVQMLFDQMLFDTN